MFFVYVLISLKDRKLYVGFTTDLDQRITRQNNGHAAATIHHLPMKLIYYEAYLIETEAKRREKYLKGGNGREQLKQQLSATLRHHRYKYL